jgi:exopolysaccharide production protein ExoZ
LLFVRQHSFCPNRLRILSLRACVRTYGTAAVLVVVGALELENNAARRRSRRHPLLAFFGLVGDASYAVYLTHLFSIAILKIVWFRVGLGTEGIAWGLAFVGASVVFAVAMAILSYLVLERPVTHVLQRTLKYRAVKVGRKVGYNSRAVR